MWSNGLYNCTFFELNQKTSHVYHPFRLIHSNSHSYKPCMMYCFLAIALCIALCTHLDDALPTAHTEILTENNHGEESVRTPGGSVLSILTVQNLLRENHGEIDGSQLMSRMIEVTPQRTVLMFGDKEGKQNQNMVTTHDLNASPKTITRIIKHAPIAFTLNGSPVQKISPKYNVRARGQISVAYTVHDGKPFSVALNGVGSVPLGLSLHPGLFILQNGERTARKITSNHDLDSSKTPNFEESSYDDALPLPQPPTSTNFSSTSNSSGTDTTYNGQPTTNGATGTQVTSYTFTSDGDGASCRGKDSVPREVELALAFDESFCSTYADNGQTALLAALDAVSLASQPFLRQTCIRFRVVYVEGYCKRSSFPASTLTVRGMPKQSKAANQSSDPYKEMLYRNDTIRLLTDLAFLWQSTRTHVSRDVMYLFSRMGADEDAIGRAYVGAACSAWWGVGWVQDGNSAVLSHELAHTLNAVHSNDGDIMDIPHSQWDLQWFSWRSVLAITSFVESTRASCIQKRVSPSPSYPKPTTLTPWPKHTCETAFTRKAFADCTSWTLVGKRAIGNWTKIFLSTRQADSMLYIRVHTQHGIIRGYRRSVSLWFLKPFQLGEWIMWRGKGANWGSQNIKITWPFSSIRKPTTWNTCCGRDLVIQLQLIVCSKNDSKRCVTKSFVFKVSLRCINPCSHYSYYGTPFYYWRGDGCPYC